MPLEIIVIIAVVAIAMLIIWAWLGSGAKFFDRGQEPERLSPVPPMPELLQGYRQVVLGNDNEAVALLKQAVANGTKAHELYVTLLTLYRTTGRTDKAIKMAESLLMRRNLDATVAGILVLELVANYRIAGNIYNAEGCLQNLENQRLSIPELSLLQAHIRGSHGEYEAAIKKYQKYEKDADIACSAEIALCYLKMAESSEGSVRMKHLQAAVKNRPESFDATIALAEAYFTENKDAQGIEVLAKTVKGGMIMSREAMQEVEELYYKHASIADLYELMNRQQAASASDPMPYLFLSTYYGKKGEEERATSILKDYLAAQEPLIIVLKQYSSLASDTVLRKLISGEKQYKCGHCHSELETYTKLCPKCGSLETLLFK